MSSNDGDSPGWSRRAAARHRCRCRCRCRCRRGTPPSRAARSPPSSFPCQTQDPLKNAKIAGPRPVPAGPSPSHHLLRSERVPLSPDGSAPELIPVPVPSTSNGTGGVCDRQTVCDGSVTSSTPLFEHIARAAHEPKAHNAPHHTTNLRFGGPGSAARQTQGSPLFLRIPTPLVLPRT